MDYVTHVLIIALIYIGLVQGLNLSVGDAGLMSLSHAGLAGCGAYCSAILSVKCGLPVVFTLLAGSVVAAAIALLLGLVAARLTGDYFAVATLALQICAVEIWINARPLTGGAVGIFGIPPLGIGRWVLTERLPMMVFLVVAVIATTVLCRYLRFTAWGLAVRASREDRTLVKSAGHSLLLQQCCVLALSGAIVGVFGAVLVHYTGYINPTVFDLRLSILLLSAVIVGGAGTAIGPTVGAAMLVILPEALRAIPAVQPFLAEVRLALGAVLLGAALLLRPRGLMGGIDLGTHPDSQR